MRTCSVLAANLLLLAAVPNARAQEKIIPPGDANPVLRVEAGGPTSLVNSLAFSPDGRTLYTAGWDKVVHVWRLDAKGEWWRPATAYRVPLGPGADGKINAIAVSSDGNWLAVAGSGTVRSRAGFRQVGIVVPSLAMSTEMRQDQGVIYVFDVNARTAQVLRGHKGPVFALTFAAAAPGAPKNQAPPLISAAREFKDKVGYRGAIRVWDTAKGTHQTWPTALPDVGTMGRPGLTVWRTEQGLHVTAAWQDGTLRVWDVARGKDGVTEQKDARYNMVVAALPGRLLTGGVRSPSGYLQEWKTAGDGTLQAGATIPDPTRDLAPNTAYVPLALTLFSSKANAPPDHAAVAVFLQVGQEKKSRVHLHILDLDPARFGALKADIPLWIHSGSMPTLAATPGGYLALSDPEGQKGHGILVYVIQDLLTKGNKAQPWLLSGVGETFRYVSFVRGKKGLGLLLNAEASPEIGSPPRGETRESDLFFDFSRPGFTKEGGWRLDAPDLGEWAVSHKVSKTGKQDQSTFDIVGGGKARKIRLEAGQKVTQFAFLPPVPAIKVPLLAVATAKFGEPSLLLYDADSGNLIRQLTGHDDFIRGLAFSADGKLLVSAAEDQTVCLWTLTSLPQFLGEHGLLTGLAVKDGAKGTVTVGRVAEGSAAAADLAEGDVIEGLIVKEKLKPAGTATMFYNAVWEMKPGTNLTLQLAGKGQKTLKVDQAVDERHPLLTLFVKQAAKNGQRDWIAWNPQGPFTDSGRQAEDYLGWHLNTGKPDEPTSFAKAGEGEYRKRYYKAGLLGPLVKRTQLAPALEDLKKAEDALIPPDPRVLVRIGEELLEAGRADDKGVIAVQPRQLVLHVKVDDFPTEMVNAVKVAVDGNGLQKIEPSSETEWSFTPPAWPSGEHSLRVVVYTPGGRRSDYTVGPLKVRYQPPAPELTTELLRRQVVKKTAFMVRATARPAVPGQEVAITVSLNNEIVARPRGPEIDQRVELRRGDNLIEITAVNKNALPGYEKNETSRITMEVVFNPQAPQIVLNDIVPLSGKDKGAPVAVTPGERVIVSLPRILARGTIEAEEELTAATVDGSNLSGFTPGKKATINQEITLAKPGPQKVTFAVSTKNAEAKRAVEVEYHPRLASVVFLPPPEPLVFFDEGKGPPEVTLRFQMKSSLDTFPFAQAQVLINGEPQKAAPAIDDKNKELTVKFKPQVRDSFVQVRLSAPFAEPQTSEGIAVQYLRVPYGIEFVKPPAESETPEIELTARVQSPLLLRAQDIKASVGDRPIQNVVVQKQQAETWLVRLKNVSLDGLKGSKNNLLLSASNVDGTCRVPATCSVIYKGPPPPRAKVEILAPLDVNVTEPAVIVQFRVTTESRLQQLTLVNEATQAFQALDVSHLPDKPVTLKIALAIASRDKSKVVDVAALKVNARGFLEAEGDLALIPGVNRLRVLARNEAGEQQSSAAVVNFLPPPVRVLLDRLEPLEGGQAIAIKTLADGRLNRSAPQGQMLLHGWIVWNKERDDRLKDVERLVLRVNGVQQVDQVQLDAPAADKPRARSFRVKVFLSKPADNRLEVELPGLPLEDCDRQVYLAGCDKPVPEKRMLHVLIIGISEKNPDDLKNRVLAALGATNIHEAAFTLAPFDRGLVYGPLVDDDRPVEYTDVFKQFLKVRISMDALARGDWYSHVVMVYYQGNEVVKGKEYFLRTSGKSLDPEMQFYRIPFKSLEQMLTSNKGAQILLMDVEREAGTANPPPGAKRDGDFQLFGDSHAAVMRFAQLGRGRPVNQPSLIAALEGSLRKANRLSKVEELIAERFNQLRKAQPTTAQPSTAYDRFIPQDLRDLVIGPAQK